MRARVFGLIALLLAGREAPVRARDVDAPIAGHNAVPMRPTVGLCPAGQARDQSAADETYFTSIRLRACCVSLGAGSLTSRTPSRNSASTCSALTPSGSAIAR